MLLTCVLLTSLLTTCEQFKNTFSRIPSQHVIIGPAQVEQKVMWWSHNLCVASGPHIGSSWDRIAGQSCGQTAHPEEWIDLIEVNRPSTTSTALAANDTISSEHNARNDMVLVVRPPSTLVRQVCQPVECDLSRNWAPHWRFQGILFKRASPIYCLCTSSLPGEYN